MKYAHRKIDKDRRQVPGDCRNYLASLCGFVVASRLHGSGPLGKPYAYCETSTSLKARDLEERSSFAGTDKGSKVLMHG